MRCAGGGPGGGLGCLGKGALLAGNDPTSGGAFTGGRVGDGKAVQGQTRGRIV